MLEWVKTFLSKPGNLDAKEKRNSRLLQSEKISDDRETTVTESRPVVLDQG